MTRTCPLCGEKHEVIQVNEWSLIGCPRVATDELISLSGDWSRVERSPHPLEEQVDDLRAQLTGLTRRRDNAVREAEESRAEQRSLVEALRHANDKLHARGMSAAPDIDILGLRHQRENARRRAERAEDERAWLLAALRVLLDAVQAPPGVSMHEAAAALPGALERARALLEEVSR